VFTKFRERHAKLAAWGWGVGGWSQSKIGIWPYSSLSSTAEVTFL